MVCGRHVDLGQTLFGMVSGFSLLDEAKDTDWRFVQLREVQTANDRLLITHYK